MLQRRLREQERGEDEEEEAEKSGKKKKKGSGKGGDLRIHDLEEDLEMSSDDSNSSIGDGEEKLDGTGIEEHSLNAALESSPNELTLGH